MFTPEFWKESNTIGEALYRINQSPYKEYCEVDEFFVFLTKETNMSEEIIDELFQSYAEYVEECTRILDVKKALNNPANAGRDLKYKLLEAQL